MKRLPKENLKTSQILGNRSDDDIQFFHNGKISELFLDFLHDICYICTL